MSHIEPAPTRRGVVTQIGAVTFGSSLVSMPAITAANPDAGLLEMVTLLEAATGRLRRLYAESDRLAEMAYVSPDYPEALCFRASDYPHVCFDPDGKCGTYLFEDGYREFYEDETALSLWAQSYWSKGEAYANAHFSDKDRARVREIKAAYERWQDEIKSAEDASGLTEINQAADRERVVVADLQRRIALTPVETPEGLAAKGHASWSADYLNDRFSSLLNKPDPNWSDKREIATLSFMIDAARLSYPGSPPADRRTAA